MNVGEWIAIGGAVVGVVGWFVTLERRLAARMTHAQHERICERRNAEIRNDLEQLREDNERRHTENRETLDEIKTTVNETHRRIDAVLLRRQGG